MAAHQASPSLGFSRQEHWSGLPFPSPMHESKTWKWCCSVVSDSPQPHGLLPTRLLHPWNFPGKSTGVGCHCFPNYFTILWWFLPYIHMNQTWAYMCPHPDPPFHLLPHPSGSSHCTSPEYPVSCINPGLATYFTYDNIHVSRLFFQVTPPSLSHTESKSLVFTSVSLLLSHI